MKILNWFYYKISELVIRIRIWHIKGRIGAIKEENKKLKREVNR